MRAPRREFAAVLLLTLLISAAGVLTAAPMELQDRAALDFQATLLDGGSLQLSSLKGKVVLLNFWGIWCAPCRQEIPKLQAMPMAALLQLAHVL